MQAAKDKGLNFETKKGEKDVYYVDDDVLDAYDNQADNLGEDDSQFDDNDSEGSGFQTYDEGSTVKDDDSFVDGQIKPEDSDAIVHFDEHQDSIYCVAALEEPTTDGTGSLLFVSGDG